MPSLSNLPGTASGASEASRPENIIIFVARKMSNVNKLKFHLNESERVHDE